ncbi:hypothetical protein BV509_02490 [Rhodovulum sulfidophilum]|uniref:Dihydroneopterin aldolase n=1 Tax=Rhodovulum visakhapatnamense TaxID=364297 RepID=A0A4R8G1E5_9RHOB|nr:MULTISPECIES: dihydroneopterin aldolase [Rhodovulum]MBL3570670.1 dihydroneopterin aldolase [Rhodovulum visakhapatnamense]MBL3577690.1 dihydroneopterin aldolase [Rhodovulum visakhapatnamense]OLS43312.1 hypothetical protein BV509_02490 [Rhodovulum sulfidophilum]TDX33413.1 dihydroneopterin aldolase [Rhodovulum visakhapatnamense]
MSRYRIVLEDLEIRMYLGIHDFEKKAPQRVLICAEIDVTSRSFGKDDIFDYDRVVAFIRAFSMQFIETQEDLVVRIHDHILSLGALSATVYSRKPDVFEDCKSVGVSYRGD